MSSSLGEKSCCLSSKLFGGVALSSEVQPGLDEVGIGGEKEGIFGAMRGCRKHIYIYQRPSISVKGQRWVALVVEKAQETMQYTVWPPPLPPPLHHRWAPPPAKGKLQSVRSVLLPRNHRPPPKQNNTLTYWGLYTYCTVELMNPFFQKTLSFQSHIRRHLMAFIWDLSSLS